MASSSLPFINQPIPARIAGFSLTATFFVLALLGLAHHNFRGEILDNDSSGEVSSLRLQSYAVSEQQPAVGAAVPAAAEDDATSYYVFLAKYPLQSSFIKVYHTEVIVCPRENFSSDPSFLTMIDGLVDTLMPSTLFDGTATVHEEDATKQPFAQIDKDQWTKQTNDGCVQLGYGGANCGTGCCGSPSKYGNRNYALSSTQAVISNAVGAKKELYFYGVSGSTDESGSEAGIGGVDAYKAVCHGHMNAIEMAGDLPKCVSDWSGRSYNPLTNNCNTFTSTVLKCVYGLSDAKPHLGVSDLRTVTCPNEKRGDGTEMTQCVIPTIDGPKLGEDEEVVDKQSTISME